MEKEEVKEELLDWQTGFKPQVKQPDPIETTETTQVAETTETKPEVVAETKEVEQTQTTTETQATKKFIEIVTAQPTEEDLKEKEYEQKFNQKYQDKLSLAQKIEQSEALKFIVDNFEKIDLEKAFANQKVDYSKLSHLDLQLEVARQNGIDITAEVLAEETERMEAKLESMGTLERDLYKKELLAKIPQPQDNSSYLEKEKERIKSLSEQEALQKQQELAYWQGKEQFAMSIKPKLVGVELDGASVPISNEMVESVYSKLGKGWGAARYNDDKGDYRPELEIEDLLYAEIGRNADKIRAEAKEEGRLAALLERTNASQDSTTVAATTDGTKLSPEQLKLKQSIMFAYSDPESRDAELRKHNLL